MIARMESAIILTVPEAEPLVGELRAEGDASGMPAHVTLLYPFVPDPDDGVVAELRFFFAHVDSFPLVFSTVGEFPEVVYLAPDEPADLAELTGALVRRWPGFLPYDGLFDEVVPHLTVVDTPDSLLRARARAHLSGGLPVKGHASEASLWVLSPHGWTQKAAFPLAPEA